MITSLIEVLELPNLVIRRHLQYNSSQVKKYFGEAIDKNHDLKIFVLKYLYFKKA